MLNSLQCNSPGSVGFFKPPGCQGMHMMDLNREQNILKLFICLYQQWDSYNTSKHAHCLHAKPLTADG